ncbi:MAG: MFS transporter [Methanothrix sp.]|jgi:MFS family permease|uniref:Major facilitator superfamily MFS_1 n=1 Tax=Methanothrix harundinacea TaxID=301375 RepID=A0A101IM88_9EURY|nr:MAG: Major facilitator superfamily MFS_1 [Methanothrix harundinacea]MDD2638282.1 MFS transporter [Methanothrix sp.]MDI9398594.1 MFS transporter [Euryarchaeota archaeon]KUK97470.1 MAG: Major facilitator superfamily MFS_1 [Methanothrix harundinacea]MCP1392242.1 MFS transporter [Methanothrix harundinacea]
MNSDKRQFDVLFISVFAAMLGLGIVGPLLPIYADNLGASGLWIGMIFSGFAAARAIFMPIVGRLSDKSGRKKFIVAGLFAYAILSLGYVTAGSVYSLTAVRFFHGIASAMVVPIAMAYIGDLSKSGEEGTYMAKFQVSFFLGLGSGPLLGGVLNDAFGFSSAFYAMASLSALSFLVIVAFLPETEGRSSSGRMRISFRDAFSQPAVPAVLAFTAINAIARGALLVFMPLFAPEISVVPGEVGLILTASIFLMAIFQIPLGRMADRGSATKMILTGSIVSAGSLTLIPKSSSFLDLFFVASVNGLGSALMMPALMAITVKIGKKIGMGTSMGAYNTAMSLGMITAPLLGGVVMDAFSIGAVFLLGGGIGVGTTIPIYILTRRALRLVETDKLS